MTCSRGDAVRLGLALDLRLDQRRVDVAGADRVAGDAVLGRLQRRDLGEADDAVLGRHIGRLERRGDQAVRRGDIDDAAPLVLAACEGRASRVVWKADDRLIARMASHFSAGKSSSGATCWMPALLTRMSMPAGRIAVGLDHLAMARGFDMSAPE